MMRLQQQREMTINDDRNFSSSTNNLLTNLPVTTTFTSNGVDHHRRQHSHSIFCRKKTARLCDVIVCAKSTLAWLAATMLSTCLLLAIFIISKQQQQYQCSSTQPSQRLLDDDDASDNTVTFQEPPFQAPPAGVSWGEFEQWKGIVHTTVSNNTAVQQQPPRYTATTVRGAALPTDALKFFYVVNGQPPTLPRASYETLASYISTQSALNTTSTFTRDRTVHYAFVALAADVLERCKGSEGLRLNFIQYLGIRSAFVNLKAAQVVLHANCSFYGPYMDELRRLVGDSAEVVNADDEQSTFRRFRVQPLPDVKGFRMENGAELYLYHRADFIKLSLAYELGGIVADFDMLFQPSSAELLHTVGRFAQCSFGNDNWPEDIDKKTWTLGVNLGITFCQARAEFLAKWLDGYQHDYRRKYWTYNSGIMPTLLLRDFPDRNEGGVLVLDGSMSLLSADVMVMPHPSSENVKKWRASSALHHQSHVRKVFMTPLLKDFKFNRHSSILARAMRQILYGSEKVCTDVKKFPPLSEEDLL